MKQFWLHGRFTKEVGLEWHAWLEILKQYGPVVGLLLGFIIWQTVWINKLLDRHEKAYSGEIQRMSGQMNKLLEHVLGKQPSSTDAPKVKELVAEAEDKKKQLPTGSAGSSTGKKP